MGPRLKRDIASRPRPKRGRGKKGDVAKRVAAEKGEWPSRAAIGVERVKTGEYICV